MPFGARAGQTRALPHGYMKPRDCVSSTNSAVRALLARSKRAAGLGIAQGAAAAVGAWRVQLSQPDLARKAGGDGEIRTLGTELSVRRFSNLRLMVFAHVRICSCK